MVNRFENYKKEQPITCIVGNAKFSSDNVGERYTLVGTLEGYSSSEQFELSEEKTPIKKIQIGRGLSEIYLVDSEENVICLEGNRKKIESLFTTNESPE